MALAIGRENLPQVEFVCYVGLFLLVFSLIGLVVWRAYPSSRFNRGFGTDNVFGAAVAAVWSVLFLIALVTILRFYSAVPWKGQETTQLGVMRQVQLSQLAPVLEVGASPHWQLMTPWFPAPVNPRL